jgi:DNA-binding transcriptional LysR family regulator
MNKLKAIETFICVVEANGFAAAARQMNSSAPTVSRTIKELEASLGVLLLKRTTRNFTLTKTGQHYYDDNKLILSKLNEAEIAARSSYNQPVGRLNVSAPRMFGSIHVTPIIAAYTSQYPETSVNAVFEDEIVDFVEDNIDVAIRIGHLKDSSLIAKKVASVRWVVCGSPAYLKKNGTPASPDDLMNHKLVNLTVRDYRYNWRFKNAQKIPPKNDLIFNSILAAKAAALSDWGLIQALSYQVATEIQEGSLIPVLEDYATSPIPVHILHAEGKRASAKITAFSELASQGLQSDERLKL